MHILILKKKIFFTHHIFLPQITDDKKKQKDKISVGVRQRKRRHLSFEVKSFKKKSLLFLDVEVEFCSSHFYTKARNRPSKRAYIIPCNYFVAFQSLIEKKA